MGKTIDKRICYCCGKKQLEGDIFVGGHYKIFCSNDCVEEYEMGLKGWMKKSKVLDEILAQFREIVTPDCSRSICLYDNRCDKTIEKHPRCFEVRISWNGLRKMLVVPEVIKVVEESS